MRDKNTPWYKTISNIVDSSRNNYNVKTNVNAETNTFTVDYTTRQTRLSNQNYRHLVDGHVDQYMSQLSNMFKKKTGDSFSVSEINRDDRLLYYGKTGNGDHYITHTRTYKYEK